MNPCDVTVEIGLKAFEETGLEPASGVVYDVNRNCGCLIGALLLQESPEYRGHPWTPTNNEAFGSLFTGELARAWDLAIGFDMGFCGDPDDYLQTSFLKVGHAIGAEMRRRRDEELLNAYRC